MDYECKRSIKEMEHISTACAGFMHSRTNCWFIAIGQCLGDSEVDTETFGWSNSESENLVRQ